MRGKWILISFSIVLAAVGAGALTRLRQHSRAEAAPPKSAPVAPAGEVSLSGIIEAQHVAIVGAQVDGSVTEFLVEVGREVYEGELLARIGNEALQSATENAKSAMDLAQSRVDKAGAAILSARLEATRARADAVRARSEYDRAQRAYQRQKVLHGEGATPRLTYEKAEREFEASQAQHQSLEELARLSESRVDDLLKELDAAKRILQEKSAEMETASSNLAGAEVHSPVDGLVVERKGEVGKELGPQERAELFRIAVDVAELQVRVNPDPGLLKQLQPGAAALIFLADLGGEPLAGTVKEIQGKQAIVAFTSPDPAIKPGMTAQVKFKNATN